MSLDFAKTPMGRNFFEHTLPDLVKAITELTKEMKRSNDLHVKTDFTDGPQNLNECVKEFVSVNEIDQKELVEVVAELYENEFKEEADIRYREEFEEEGREGMIDPENYEPDRDESRD